MHSNFSLFCLLVIYQDIKNADFTVPIPKVTDPLNEKESKGSEVPKCHLLVRRIICVLLSLSLQGCCVRPFFYLTGGVNTEGEEEKKSVYNS